MSFSLSAEQRLLLDQMLESDGAGPAPDRVVARGGDPATAPLSFGQERLYFVDRMQPGSSMYVGSGFQRLRGSLDVDVLSRSVAFLVDRHEVLRTGLVETADGVEQRVHAPGTVAVTVPVQDVTRAQCPDAMARLSAEGFDLARPPLLRAALLRVRDVGQPEWILGVAAHHVAVDGWSLAQLIRELNTVYTALSTGTPPVLPDLPVQYADFAVWQRGRLERGDFTEDLDFWRTQLRDLPSTELVTDRPRPATRSYAGGTVPVTVPAVLARQLQSVTTEVRATAFMALVAAWSVVLGRWSGENDVVVGAPLAGRQRPELENVVGFFVNTLPMRIGLRPADSYRSLLERTRDVCTDAYAHQDVPFDQLVAELRTGRDESGQTAIARHWFALHSMPVSTFALPGLECEVLPAAVTTVRCDLSMQLSPDGTGGFTGHLEYSSELFDRSTAERLAEAFGVVLAAAAADPGVPLRDLPVLTGTAYDEVVRRFSGAGVEIPAGPSLVARFEDRVDATPDAVAVLAGGAATTYREVGERANQIAHLLRARGVRTEDVVGVCLERGPELAAAALGILAVGAVYLPLDAEYPPARLAQLVEDSDPGLILTDDRLAGLFPDRDGVVGCARARSAEPVSRPGAAPVTGENPAYLLFTSGSTGRPKGVLNTHAALLNRLDGMQREFGLGAADRVLQKAPLGFDVSVWELLWPLVSGATVVCAREGGHRDPQYLHELIDAAGVTVCHFVPSMLEAFIAAGGGAHPGVRVLLSGGETLPASTARQALERYPHARLYNQYGPAEAAIDVSSGPVTDPVPARVPIGKPVPGAELYVLDAAFRPQPVGVPGELFIGGVQVARGYLNAPGATAARFVPHPFAAGRRLYATGDRARWLAGGELEFLGRSDGQVKIRGNRVEPGEVEAVLRDHPAVKEGLVTVRPGAEGGPALLAYATVADPADPDLPQRIQESLRSRLTDAMMPRHLFLLAEWPIGVHGKIDLAALPTLEDLPVVTEPAAEEQGTPVETALAGICAELLEVGQVGLHESFFDLGGHSLLALKAISRIRKQFGVRVPIGQFFATPTVSGLAKIVEQLIEEAGPALAAPIQAIDRSRYVG